MTIFTLYCAEIFIHTGDKVCAQQKRTTVVFRVNRSFETFRGLVSRTYEHRLVNFAEEFLHQEPSLDFVAALAHFSGRGRFNPSERLLPKIHETVPHNRLSYAHLYVAIYTHRNNLRELLRKFFVRVLCHSVTHFADTFRASILHVLKDQLLFSHINLQRICIQLIYGRKTCALFLPKFLLNSIFRDFLGRNQF